MKFKPSKCEFFKQRIAYLGHIVADKGIKTDPKKIEAIVNWPVPKTVHDDCSFLGFTKTITGNSFRNMPRRLSL